MRIEHKIVALSVVCGLCVWLVDAFLDRELFYQGSFWELLITSVPTHELYIRTSILALFAAFGVLASRCVGKRRSVEASLRESHDFLQTVIDGIPDAVMVIDLDYRIVLTNSTKGQFAGDTSDVAGPRLCYQVCHHRSTPCDGMEHPCPLRLVVETRDTVTTTHAHYGTDGHEITVEVRASPIFDEAGEVIQIIESFRDVTERHRAAEQLREQRNRAQRYLDIAGVMLVALNADGMVTLINKKGCEILGWDEQNVVGEPWFDNFVPKEIRETIKADFHNLIAGSVEFAEYYENPVLRKDGSQRLVAWHNTVLRDPAGNVTGTLSSGEDITARREADAELKKTSVFLDSMSEALTVTDSKLRIIQVNQASCDLWGYSRQEMLGKSALELFYSQEESGPGREREIAAFSATVKELEAVVLTKDGRMVPVDVSGRTLKDEQGDVIFIAVLRDIAERKRSQEAFVRYQNQLRSLVSQLTTTEERERKEIETALHDDLLQRLALCKMRLDELSRLETPKGHTGSLSEIAESIREAIRDARSLTFDLTSPVLYDIGLEAAIRDWLDREVRGKYDVTFEFEDDGQPRQLSNDLRVLLYRAVRELCTNVIKHSRATRAKVLVRSNRGEMEIIVEDDGIGMANQVAENGPDDFGFRGGLGLFGIRERLDYFGAGMKIESHAGTGTRIILTVPSYCVKIPGRARE